MSLTRREAKEPRAGSRVLEKAQGAEGHPGSAFVSRCVENGFSSCTYSHLWLLHIEPDTNSKMHPVTLRSGTRGFPRTHTPSYLGPGLGGGAPEPVQLEERSSSTRALIWGFKSSFPGSPFIHLFASFWATAAHQISSNLEPQVSILFLLDGYLTLNMNPLMQIDGKESDVSSFIHRWMLCLTVCKEQNCYVFVSCDRFYFIYF